MQKKILVVATNQEYAYAQKYSKLEIIKTEPGPSNVIEKLKDVKKNTKIINVGFAGSNSLPVGSIAKIKNSYLYHPNVTFREKVYNLGGEVDCYTSNDFVLSTSISEPVVFDMELNAICAFGFQVESYKIVSDNLNLTDYERAEAQKVNLENSFKKVFEIIGE